jgi:hypothetical protein
VGFLELVPGPRDRIAASEQEERMHARIVRFTDTDPDRIDGIRQRIEESDGPPEGVPSTGVEVMYDESQSTAVVVQYYESAEDMRKGAEVMGQMDASETPGTRVSVDSCEIKVQKRLG